MQASAAGRRKVPAARALAAGRRNKNNFLALWEPFDSTQDGRAGVRARHTIAHA